jgi:hypothetical protein
MGITRMNETSELEPAATRSLVQYERAAAEIATALGEIAEDIASFLQQVADSMMAATVSSKEFAKLFEAERLHLTLKRRAKYWTKRGYRHANR